jgi:hypothetical protein
MYARVLKGQYKPGTFEEATRLYRDSYVPAAQQQQGFKGTLFLTDPTTGAAMTVGLWETEADMKANEANGFLQEQLAKFADLFAGPPTLQESYEVSVQV